MLCPKFFTASSLSVYFPSTIDILVVVASEFFTVFFQTLLKKCSAHPSSTGPVSAYVGHFQSLYLAGVAPGAPLTSVGTSILSSAEFKFSLGVFKFIECVTNTLSIYIYVYVCVLGCIEKLFQVFEKESTLLKRTIEYSDF